MADQPSIKDTYQGVGKVSYAIDGAATGYLAGIVGTAMFAAFKKKPALVESRWAHAISAAIATVLGYVGYKRAKAGEDQFAALKEQNAALLNERQNLALGGMMANSGTRTYNEAAPMSAPELASAMESPASPVSVDEPTIKEPVIKTPAIAPAPTTRSFAETAPAPKPYTEAAPAPMSEHGGHGAAVEASQHAAQQVQATL